MKGKNILIALGLSVSFIAGGMLVAMTTSKPNDKGVQEMQQELQLARQKQETMKKENGTIEKLEREKAKLEQQLEDEREKNINISNNTTIPESPIQSYDGISIGDKIQTWGYACYDTYEEFIDYYGLPKAMWFDHQAIGRNNSGQRYGGTVDPDYVYEVVFIAKHLDQDKVLYVVQNNDNIFILDKSNIKEVL